MEFIDEQSKKVILSTFSKSFGETYQTCPLKAWLKVRHKDVKESSRALELGKYTHELFAQRIATEYMGEKYNVSKEEFRDPAIKYEGRVMMNKVNLDVLIESKSEVLGYEYMAKHFLPNGLELIGIFDLILLKESASGPYIQIIDLKTGFKLAKEVDLQCLCYVYLASQLYPDLPILFTTVSSRTGDEWGKFFKAKEARDLEDLIVDFSSEVKLEVESEERPVPKAGAHCLQCPFLETCTARDCDETDVGSMMNSYQWAKAYSKSLEDKLKAFRKNQKDDKAVSSGTGFVIDYNETISESIATKGTKKSDLLVLLSKAGVLDEVIDSLELTLSDKVIAKAKEFGVEFKPKITRRVAIKEDSEEV